MYKKDFPLLNKQINNKPLYYLDNAATTQKPQVVLDALNDYYLSSNANIHRGVHYLSAHATELYEECRETVRSFINARYRHECIFTKGATEAINLIASSYGEYALKPGDEIIISSMEHHANIVPWLMLKQRYNINIKSLPINDGDEIAIEQLSDYLSAKTKLIALNYVSNTLGTINPIKQAIELANLHNIPILIDASQALPHLPIDVQSLNCDFLVFTSHKLYGPTGVGVLYGKEKWLDCLPPYQGGGDMILKVSLDEVIYNSLPNKFEAGTPNIAGVIGLKQALDYLTNIGWDEIITLEQQLLNYATCKLKSIPGLTIIGNAKEKVAIVSFTLDKIHPHDLGTILDSYNVAIRSGHHCTMPLLNHYQLSATARASLALYNDTSDIDALYNALLASKKVFA